MQNSKSVFCNNYCQRNVKDATYYLKEMVRAIGGGFHPDTYAEEYVNSQGEKSFTPEQCEKMNFNLAVIHSIFGDHVYKRVFEFWHEFGMIDTTYYFELLGKDENMTNKEMVDMIHHILLTKQEMEVGEGYSFHIYEKRGELDSIIVHFLEADGKPTIHRIMDWLAKEIWNKTGRHVMMSHNSPTDGSVHIWLVDAFDVPYDRKTCCFDTFVTQWMVWDCYPYQDRVKMQNHAVYVLMDHMRDRMDIGDYDIVDFFDPDMEFWQQAIYKNIHGLSECHVCKKPTPVKYLYSDGPVSICKSC